MKWVDRQNRREWLRAQTPEKDDLIPSTLCTAVFVLLIATVGMAEMAR